MQFVRTWFGIFSVNDGTINSCDLYPKDVKSLADRLQETPVALECIEVCGNDICSLAKDLGFIGSENEYDDLFRQVNIEHAMMQVTASGSDEHILIQFIDALDDLDKNTNALSERLKELYDLHFPELGLKGEPLARFISGHGVRNNISNWNIEDEKILDRARNSSGMELPGPWGISVTELATTVAGLYDNKNRISLDIEEYMNNNLPNLSAVAGAHIGARLLGIVGSSKKLASMPSSTIQVLGAEKALFKHLRGNAPSPKHGVIFQHPLVKESPWWLRGKIARVLASKISIAVRIDYYSGTFDEDIAKDLYRKVDELHKKYPKPRRKHNKSGLKVYKGHDLYDHDRKDRLKSPILKYFLKQLCLMAQTNNSIMSPTIAKILSGYDRDNLTIATVTSHTSLQLFDGARKEGLKTIGISIGKPPKFYDAFPLAKPDEFIIVDSYADILDKAPELAEKNAIIIPTGSFVEYLGHEKFMDLELPTFGNRHVLEWESDRDKERHWLEGAGISMPNKIEDPKDIKSPVMVKYHGAKGGRGFFVAKNKSEFYARLDESQPYTIQEFIVGTRYYLHYFYSPLPTEGYTLSKGTLELMSMDRRVESNADEIFRLGSPRELEDAGVYPTFVVTGNVPLVARESLLPKIFELGEQVVESSLDLFGGMIGPFCLETVCTDELEFRIFEISARIVAGTNLYMSGSPYSDLIGPNFSTGRRIAREIKKAVKYDKLEEVLS